MKFGRKSKLAVRPTCNMIKFNNEFALHAAYPTGVLATSGISATRPLPKLLCAVLFNKKHLKNVGPIRHCEPPHAACFTLPFTRCRYCRTPSAHRCPQQHQRQQRQRVTEGTAMAPWNGPNYTFTRVSVDGLVTHESASYTR